MWGEAAASNYMLMVQPAGWISLSAVEDRHGVEAEDSLLMGGQSDLYE